MNSVLEQVVEKIEVLNPVHGKKLRKVLPFKDAQYVSRAEKFLREYTTFLAEVGKDMDYGIDCYLRMCSDVMHETIAFQESGSYTSKSFADTNQRVYSNPEVMEYYMHALILSEFLWVHHYKLLDYFVTELPAFAANATNYLEIGAGHGLFVSEAIRIVGPSTQIDVVDISPSSIEMTKRFVQSSRVNFHLKNIFDYKPKAPYDLITMGEVLEHVEDPVQLLTKVRDLLGPNGIAYITTPTNAPAIDHLYLFRNTEEIRTVIHKAGLHVVKEFTCYAENLPPEVAEKMKVTMMYAGFLKK